MFIAVVGLVFIGVIAVLLLFPRQVDRVHRWWMLRQHDSQWNQAAEKLGLRRDGMTLEGQVDDTNVVITLEPRETWLKGRLRVSTHRELTLHMRDQDQRKRTGLAPMLEAIVVLGGDLRTWCAALSSDAEGALVRCAMSRPVAIVDGVFELETTGMEEDADTLVQVVRGGVQLASDLLDPPTSPDEIIQRIRRASFFEARVARLRIALESDTPLREAAEALRESGELDKLALALAQEDAESLLRYAEALPVPWIVDAVRILKERKPSAAYGVRAALRSLDELVSDSVDDGLERHGRGDGPPAGEPPLASFLHAHAVMNKSLDKPTVRAAAKKALAGLLHL